MTNDRELLEAAAKAAGMIPTPPGMDLGEPGPMSKGGLVFSGNGECIDWNPLTDDGDALRLAVKLNLTLRCYMGNTCAQATTPGGPAVYIDETNHDDPAAATRRAIVRAAAALAPTP